MPVVFGKKTHTEKKALVTHDKNCYYFCESNFPVNNFSFWKYDQRYYLEMVVAVFLLLIFLIIGLCNSSANSLLEIFLFLTVLYKALKQNLYYIHHF